jgi:hypothetical protein
VAAIEEVAAHGAMHRRAAREIAEAHFDPKTVLESLLERALAR